MYTQTIQVMQFDRTAQAGRIRRTPARRRGIYADTCARVSRAAAAAQRSGVRAIRAERAEEAAVPGTRPVRVRRKSAASAVRSILCSVLLGCFFFFCMLYFHASAQEAAADHKYYTSITVGFGEDFMDLVAPYSSDAAHYPETQAYLKEVCEINNLAYNEDLTTLKIHAGDTVIVPYYSQEVLP